MNERFTANSQRACLVGSWASAVLFGGMAELAHAQATQPAAENGQNSGLAEVMVTAQRRSQDLQDVPVSVAAFSTNDLQAIGAREIEDISQLTSNVVIATNQGAGNQPLITIRGIGLNDFDSNNAGPNGVYVDDVYISAPAAQSFAVFDLDQVQVLKGPQGTLYGRNTSGGAVLFTSKQPTDTYTGDFHLEYGRFNTTYLTGAVGGPIADNLEGRISFQYNHSDGYMHNELSNNSASGTNNEAARLQLLYRPNDDLRISFSTTIGYLNDLPQEYRHVGTLLPGTQSDANPVVCSVEQSYAGGCVDMTGYGTPKGYYDGAWSRTEHLTNLSSLNILKVDYTVGAINLASISGFLYNKKYFPEDTDVGPNNILQASYHVESKTFTQEFRASQKTETYNWVGGLYYLHEDLKQDQPISFFYNGDKFGGLGIPPGPGAFDGVAQLSYDLSDQKTDSVALFGQGDYALGDLTLTLGGRYTWERKTFAYDGSTQFQSGGTGNYGPLVDIIHDDLSQTASNFTWRAAANYHITNAIMGYASVATGFKSGDFNGSFLSNDPNQALLQLQPTRPEHVTTYEVGGKSTFFERHMILNGALFYNKYTDEQLFEQIVQDGLVVNIITNARKAHTQGAEVDLTVVPIHGLQLNISPAFLRTKLDDAGTPNLNGKELSASPHFSLAATADYSVPVGNGDDVDFRWTSSYRSHEFYDSTNDPYIAQAAYWVHNLNATYQSKHGWDAGLYVRNVTNTKYATNASDLAIPFGMLEVVVAPPRTYGATLNYHF